jgi:pantoate--beta-alanine ligase
MVRTDEMTPGPHSPVVCETLAALGEALAPLRRAGRRIGLVPTMGALHEGHLSLVRASSEACDATVVSIYVNPSQFGPGEDFQRYPRTLERDLEALRDRGADWVFVPSDAEVYPPGYATWVEVESVAAPLEGACRPRHFRGVATIVLKLLNMVRPDAAFFGQKDYQQALVIRRMAADLNVPVEIRVCPTVREADGLAMSSRNAYLSPAARQRALVLVRSLREAERLAASGERDAARVLGRMRAIIASAEDARIDYVALVDPETLEGVDRIEGETLAALAVRIENTRLIDNALLRPAAP